MKSSLDRITFTRNAELIEDEHIHKKSILDLFLAALLRPSFLGADQRTPPLDNEDLIKLTDAGIPETILLRAIELYESNFDTSRLALVKLRKRGLSTKVITGIVSKQSQMQARSPQPGRSQA